MFSTINDLIADRPDDVHDIVTHATVEDVLPRPMPILVSIPHTATIGDALSILRTNGVSSAPIYNSEKNIYGRFVEHRDILKYLITCYLGRYRDVSKGSTAQWLVRRASISFLYSLLT